MSEAPAPGAVSPEALAERLGRYALGSSRDLRAAAELAAGERLRAVVVAGWRRRGWVVVATDVGVRLVRRPRILGRSRDAKFDWRHLTTIRSGQQRVQMDFRGEQLSLVAAAPHDEFVRLIETARDHAGGAERPSVEDIRELAMKKLGRLLTFGFEASIDGLPDHLEPGEPVERLAAATLGFSGLLVLTDRRLLLLDITLRRSKEREWEVRRSSIRRAEPVQEGLRLLLKDGEVTLTEFAPAERRDEFAAVLGRP